MWQQLAAATAMNLLDNKLKTSERAQAQRYATMMSNSAHQRQMADMRKAGLNPILSGKYGGASTPSVGQAPVGMRTGEFLQQMSSAKKMYEESKIPQQTIINMKETAKTIIRDREIKDIVHDERWKRLVAQMGPENMVTMATASIAGFDLEAVASGLGVNLNTVDDYKKFLRLLQQYRSTVATEVGGISKSIAESLKDSYLEGKKLAGESYQWLEETTAFYLELLAESWSK